MRILDLLQASDEPAADRKLFLKAQIVFWLLGATDGHAKNFSIFLLPGGRFRMTPLYDVMSAQPNVDAGEIPRNRMKLAMAVGDNRHYAIDVDHAAPLPPDGGQKRGGGCNGAGDIR